MALITILRDLSWKHFFIHTKITFEQYLNFWNFSISPQLGRQINQKCGWVESPPVQVRHHRLTAATNFISLCVWTPIGLWRRNQNQKKNPTSPSPQTVNYIVGTAPNGLETGNYNIKATDTQPGISGLCFAENMKPNLFENQPITTQWRSLGSEMSIPSQVVRAWCKERV